MASNSTSSNNALAINGERLWATLQELAQIGATEAGGVARVALTADDRAGRDQFVQWVTDLGCEVSIDTMGNLFARRSGRDPARSPVVVGSHLDSQPTGGKYDGAYGVMVGLEILRTLHDADATTAAPIEVVSWTNEEGARFPPAMIGSGVFGGAFTLDQGLAATAADGATLGAELSAIGYDGNEPCGERTFGYYIEPHIEQGPILEAADQTIGIVTGVQGIRWYDAEVHGTSAHAGSTPMDQRSDAMLAAAQLISGVNDIARRRDPLGRATVGVVTTGTGSRNTVLGSVSLTVDLRHPDDDELAAMDAEMMALAAKLQPAPKITQVWHSPPVVFDTAVIAALRQGAVAAGFEPVDITSGAGHDACYVSAVASTGMVFIPCEGGLSHNEAESITEQHAAAGAQTTLNAVLALAG